MYKLNKSVKSKRCIQGGERVKCVLKNEIKILQHTVCDDRETGLREKTNIHTNIGRYYFYSDS